MNQPQWMEKIGATPTKLALVAVLGVVFLAVVLPQLGGSTEAYPVISVNKQKVSADKQPDKETRAPKTEVCEYCENKHEWPEVLLDETVHLDPLAVPSWYVSKEKKADNLSQSADSIKKQERIDQLEKEGTRIVVITEQKKAATIGNKTVEIGDIIEGFQVSNITTEGVVLTELLSN